MKVAVVTDATSSISPSLALEAGIRVVPVPVQFGATTFLDGVDPPKRFYELLASGVLPTTAAPSPGTFAEVYKKLSQEFDAIVSVHVMATKSAVCQSARIAAGMLPDREIHVVDSGQVTMGLGLMALGAARLARAGRSAKEIVSWLEGARPRCDVFAAIRQLNMLRRSGRVSLGKALLADFMDIKPLLHLRDGAVDVCGQVRSWQRAVARAVEMAAETATSVRERLQVAVVHTNAPAEVGPLVAALQQALSGVEVVEMEAGPALASHAGPGALGICVLREPDET